MDLFGLEWLEGVWAFLSRALAVATTEVSLIRNWLVDLQSQYPQLFSPQTLFGLIGTGLAVWRWWEGREANLYRRFERMIERNEAELVKARSDLIDVVKRPGPGLLVRPPLFAERPLRQVLSRRRWHPSSLVRIGQATDRRLESAIRTCDRKVSAHQDRLGFFRQQIASARLIQGAIAAARAAWSQEEHRQQRLDQEALDHFRAVLALPGHQEDVAALELVAHQLARLDGPSQSTVDAYRAVIQRLEGQQPSPRRNLILARAKRSLAVLRYPTAPGTAQGLLSDAIGLLTELGPPRDRDFLELADTVHLDGIARLRLNMIVMGPQQLSLAQGHYRDLIRSLQGRRRGLFRWMSREKRFSGHRIAELQARAEYGLASVNHLLALSNRRQTLLIRSLRKGSGEPRRNRKPPRSLLGH
jgi:hypothetical protein